MAPLRRGPAVRFGLAALLCAAAALAALRGWQDPPRPAAAGALPAGAVSPQASFAEQVARLSEPGGYFDTDNLISNERSYLQVVTDLRRAGVHGGAYVGVGPDTSFSYIAAVRPSIAVIVDIRRDNLLLHLLFKALFELAPSRIEYLSLLVGRAPPPDVERWRAAPIDRLVERIDGAAAVQDAAALRRRLADAVTRSGVPLSADDLATIARFHQRFIDDRLDLQFNSAGRAPRDHYPTYRELLLETDAEGRQANYLASDEAYQVVRSLQTRDQVIPVVGDLGGQSALAAVGRLLAARDETLSVFYASNVEFYLFGQGTFPRFAENLRQMPRSRQSVLIRSVFGRYLGARRPADASLSHLDAINDLLDAVAGGRVRSYGELVSRRIGEERR